MQKIKSNHSMSLLAGAVAMALTGLAAPLAGASTSDGTIAYTGTTNGKCTSFSSFTYEAENNRITIACTAADSSGEGGDTGGGDTGGGDTGGGDTGGGDTGGGDTGGGDTGGGDTGGGDTGGGDTGGGDTGGGDTGGGDTGGGDTGQARPGGVNHTRTYGSLGAFDGAYNPRVGRDGGVYHYYKMTIPSDLKKASSLSVTPYPGTSAARFNMWISNTPGGQPLNDYCASNAVQTGVSLKVVYNASLRATCELKTGSYYLNVADGVGGKQDWSDSTCLVKAGCGYRIGGF